MPPIPVRPHAEAAPSAAEIDRVETLAGELAHEQPALAPSDSIRPLIPETLEDAPSLHLDDLSEIALLDRFYDVSFFQDRARFRAKDGDFVASCGPRIPEFEAYCEVQLGLGAVKWLHPEPRVSGFRVAAACWTDRGVRQTLVRALRAGNLYYVHPHIGSFPVWATATLLRRASRRPLKVIAPHPALARSVNNKDWFADVVTRLFGRQLIPFTTFAWNYATAARLVQKLAEDSRLIVLKVPNSAGGAGNLVVPAAEFAGRSVGTIRKVLKDIVGGLAWIGRRRLLISSWETDVACAPSAQLWIPPPADGPPVVEGLYEQTLEGPEGFFVGSKPANFGGDLAKEIATRCWLLGLLYQRFGYIGRCSFDMLLVGESLERSRLKFVECNGRWGGTSIPMTLMNRLFGDWADQPYATREYEIARLEEYSFADLLDHFSQRMFDARTGCGNLILYNAGGIKIRSGIDVLALGGTWEDAVHILQVDFPQRLSQLVGTNEFRVRSRRKPV